VRENPQRFTTNYGRPFLMSRTDLMQQSSSTAWVLPSKVITASVTAPSGADPQHPSTTANWLSTARSRA